MQSLQTASLPEVRKVAARLCRDYLNGKWKEVLEKDLIVKRISGGLSNFLYYISLPELAEQKSPAAIACDDDSTANMPHEVLLRVYGPGHGGDAFENVITESVVFALLSERNFGPKLYGIFPGGRLEQFIQARALLTHELAHPKISERIAEKMAEIHSLNIPMSKEPDWIWNCIERWLKGSLAMLAGPNDFSDVPREQYECVKNFNIVAEHQWLKSFIDAGNFPVVFCHNDMQEGNILLREQLSTTSNDNHNELLNSSSSSSLSSSSLDDPDLRIIDFEYCAYNYRGFDFANHFIEWTFDYSYPEPPLYAHRPQQYPTKQQRYTFIANYLKKAHEGENNNQIEKLEDEVACIDYEVKVFSLLSHFLWTLWSVVNCTSSIEFGYWSYAYTRINEYRRLKRELLELKK